MSGLKHPTIAQQAYDEFRNSRVTISIARIVKKWPHEIELKWDCVEYTFNDDSTLLIRGRGRNHRVEVLTP